ncbi:MAG: dethiobiotin synthase [Gammaproteobacteria bacterium]|nr:dethiobiotin synthase [Gammaproteobacteria bacterium]
MQQGIFITGSDTDVGKTFVGVCIAKQLSQKNINVIPRKPVESGCIRQNNELIPPDANALRTAANYPGPLSDVCPYRFEPAISPSRAAQLANTRLTTAQLVTICQQGSDKSFLLVEGAGGFYSPLTENGLNADLAAALKLPVLLVVEDKLGALSQALLHVEAIARRGLPVAGVVLNALSNDQNQQMDNVADLRKYLDCPVFSIPYQPEIDFELPDELITSLITAACTKTSSVSVIG